MTGKIITAIVPAKRGSYLFSLSHEVEEGRWNVVQHFADGTSEVVGEGSTPGEAFNSATFEFRL